MSAERLLWACGGVAAIAGLWLIPMAAGQGAEGLRARAAAVESESPQRQTLARMMQVVTVEFQEQPLESVAQFILTTSGGADLEFLWQDDRNPAGLAKETPITLRVERVTLLALLEKVLEKATIDTTPGAVPTWQMTESGAMQVGPRERLNAFKRVEIYPIADLIMEVPNYTNAPTFNLQQALQFQGRGGGGGQNPFQEQTEETERRGTQERMDDLRTLVIDLVEREQWVDNGGDAASIRFFQGAFIISAPDYVHRQLAGYPYWPQSATRVSQAKGRRYVTLSGNVATSGAPEFQNVPVTGVVGGGGGAGGGN